jgi:hypothetical protein
MVIEMPICANELADTASTTSTKIRERMECAKRIAIPLSDHPSRARCCFAAAGCVDWPIYCDKKPKVINPGLPDLSRQFRMLTRLVDRL